MVRQPRSKASAAYLLSQQHAVQPCNSTIYCITFGRKGDLGIFSAPHFGY